MLKTIDGDSREVEGKGMPRRATDDEVRDAGDWLFEEGKRGFLFQHPGIWGPCIEAS